MIVGTISEHASGLVWCDTEDEKARVLAESLGKAFEVGARLKVPIDEEKVFAEFSEDTIAEAWAPIREAQRKEDPEAWEHHIDRIEAGELTREESAERVKRIKAGETKPFEGLAEVAARSEKPTPGARK